MKFLYLLPLLFLFNCSSNEVKAPKNILSKDKMIELMVDVHIADAMTLEKKIKDIKLSNQLKKSYLVSVLDKHNVSLEEFESSISFYEDNLEEMLEIYNEVMIKITELEAELGGEKTETSKKDKKQKKQTL